NKKGAIQGDSKNIRVNRICIVVILVLVVVYCYLMPKDIIAKATSVFMGMTAAALLPAYFHALYSKKPCKKAALASIIGGTVTYLFFALFINSGMSIFLPICKLLTGSKVLFPDSIVSFLDPLVVALPISIILMVVVLIIERNRSSESAESAAE
ncbi:MAG: sodium:solute symporter family protein, partial [Candidatus Methanomethylophilaceae archaeon]